jgi:hypothetical protein
LAQAPRVRIFLIPRHTHAKIHALGDVISKNVKEIENNLERNIGRSRELMEPLPEASVRWSSREHQQFDDKYTHPKLKSTSHRQLITMGICRDAR